MMTGGKIAEQSAEDKILLEKYGHCIERIICNLPKLDCFFQICNLCPRISDLKEHFHELMDKNITVGFY